MSGYILRENDPGIVLTADQVDRLVKNGDGDAEAFIPVQSDSQTSEWYSYFENDVLDCVICR